MLIALTAPCLSSITVEALSWIDRIVPTNDSQQLAPRLRAPTAHQLWMQSKLYRKIPPLTSLVTRNNVFSANSTGRQQNREMSTCQWEEVTIFCSLGMLSCFLAFFAHQMNWGIHWILFHFRPHTSPLQKATTRSQIRSFSLSLVVGPPRLTRQWSLHCSDWCYRIVPNTFFFVLYDLLPPLEVWFPPLCPCIRFLTWNIPTRRVFIFSVWHIDSREQFLCPHTPGIHLLCWVLWH